MQSERQFPLWLRAALPLLLALLIGLAAQPLQLEQALKAARQARAENDPVAEAHALASIAAWQPWRVGVWEEAGLKALRGDDPAHAVQYLRAAQSRQELSLQ